MTREEAIEVLENGGWWDLLIPITTIEGRIEEDKLHEALDLALTALRPVSREQVENEKLFLALRAGARAIVNNKRLHGALYCWDIWGENGGPKEISYLEAAVLLAETANKMENRPPEGEDGDANHA